MKQLDDSQSLNAHDLLNAFFLENSFCFSSMSQKVLILYLIKKGKNHIVLRASAVIFYFKIPAER